ncbi:MAG: L-histidine N(alpha)-methyltransferase [Candidatus Saccharimonadales bacterium]
MKYYRNIELTKLHNVSDKAVRNWILSTRAGKLNLDLFEQDGKFFVADTIRNNQLIDDLVERGKKYRNQRNHISLSPSKIFYSLFDAKQIIDIANSLEKYHEFPQQYRYLGEGATYWDSYLHKLYNAGRNNLLTKTLELLNLDRDYLDATVAEYESINVVDLGAGNGLSARVLIENMRKSGKLKRYIGIDISQSLLDITEHNMINWFSGKVKVEKYTRDFSHEQFADIIHNTPPNVEPIKTINIILFLGGIVGNFRRTSQVLDTIRESMGKNDILLTSLKLDSENTRRFFDFNIESDKTPLSHRNKLPLDYLSIPETSYEVEQFFDEKQQSRFIQVRLKIDISLDFKLPNFRKTVELRKGDTIMLFRSREFNDRELLELYDNNGFSRLRTTLSHNQEYTLTISKVRTKGTA